MSVAETHVPLDRLTALTLVARAESPDNEQDQQALIHVSQCDQCAAEFTRLAAQFDQLRDVAWAEADALFDDAALDGQRTRILDRLAHLGQVARVLRFPARQREAAMPVSNVSRRWVSVAAAAGLIIGLVAGQLIHFVPVPNSQGVARTDNNAVQLSLPDGGSVTIQPSSDTPVSADELLEVVESALQLDRARSLRALDALTPTMRDVVEIP